MRTHDIKSDLRAVKDEVLGGLSPADRAATVVRYRADGRHDDVGELYDTAPRKDYAAPDLEFVDIVHRYREEALYALWELETAAWRFLYEARARLDSTADEPEEGEAGEAERIAAEFLANYRAWSRYATEDVGVSLREFLLHPLEAEAVTHADRIEYVADLADGSAFDGDGVGWAADALTLEGEEWDVEDLAGHKYTEITGGVTR